MSDGPDDAFAPPPFDAAAALARLKRELREAGLAEREGRFELRGAAVARAALEADGSLHASVVRRRPSAQRTPGVHDWETRVLRSSADVRDFVAGVKRRLASGSDRDD